MNDELPYATNIAKSEDLRNQLPFVIVKLNAKASSS